MSFELDLKGAKHFNPDNVAGRWEGERATGFGRACITLICLLSSVQHWMKANQKAIIPPVPFGLTVFKGSKTFRLPRQFIDFLLNHEVKCGAVLKQYDIQGGANIY